MSDLKENLLPEILKDDNSKVEVVIKRDANEQVEELDLLHIFVNMGKKKRIYAFLIILCMLVGLATPLLMAEFAERPESVQAIITLNFENADKLLAPDGEALDINYISSSYILQNAINRTKLSNSISVSALANNLKLERLLTEGTRQNLEVMSQRQEKITNQVPDVQEVQYNYENQIILTLANDFGDKDSNRKVRLDGNELATLLNNITEEYNDYFFDRYSQFVLPDEDISNMDMSSMDYIERLDSMLSTLNVLARYCSDKEKEEYLDYRSKLDGMSFKDIYDCIMLVRDIDIDYLYAYVFYNCIAIDRLTTVTKYEYSMRNMQQAMSILNENIKTNSGVISNYKNDEIVIASSEGEPSPISTSVTDYYNELISKQAEFYKEKSETQTEIDNLNDKISGFKNSVTQSSQLAYVENELDSIYNICSELYKLTVAHANEIINSDFFRDSFISVIGAQYSGTGFMSSATVKKALIGAVVGGILAVVVWCGDGLVTEFKLSNKKKEEREEA